MSLLFTHSLIVFLSLLGLDEEIKRDELGPNRHSAEFRIKKSQVLRYLYYLVVLCRVMYYILTRGHYLVLLYYVACKIESRIETC